MLLALILLLVLMARFALMLAGWLAHWQWWCTIRILFGWLVNYNFVDYICWRKDEKYEKAHKMKSNDKKTREEKKSHLEVNTLVTFVIRGRLKCMAFTTGGDMVKWYIWPVVACVSSTRMNHIIVVWRDIWRQATSHNTLPLIVTIKNDYCIQSSVASE